MNQSNAKHVVQVLGIDLGKNAFQLCGINEHGKKLLDKKLSRQQLKSHIVQMPPCLIGMEACGGAHYWARLFRSYGHDVRLMAPQFVKPYVKSNKNDRADAEAIGEAVQRSTMRFVAIKEVEQQDIQCLHRIRSQVVANRTAQTNQIRGLLLEYGIDIPQGRRHVRSQIPGILEDADNGLSARLRRLLSELYEELTRLDARVEALDREVAQAVRDDEQVQRLMTIPGFGPLCATALIAAIGDVSVFRNGREMAAWVGLVPRQCSTGGKDRLLGISKRGDVYLRTILIHGARAALRVTEKKQDSRSRWARRIVERRNKNIAAVAMANKMVRTAYAILKHGGVYCADTPAVA